MSAASRAKVISTALGGRLEVRAHARAVAEPHDGRDRRHDVGVDRAHGRLQQGIDQRALAPLELAHDGEAPKVDIRALGELAALQGVIKFPVRIKCATLAWNTLVQGLGELN